MTNSINIRKSGRISSSIKLLILALSFGCLFAISGCEESKKETTTAQIPEVVGGFHEIEFVYIKDADKFEEYRKSMTALPIMKTVELVLSIVPTQVWAKDFVKPDFVNLVYYENSASKEELLNDKSYMALAELRDEAIVKLTVSGKSIGGETVPGKKKKRAYMLEFVQYIDGDSSAYGEYLTFATAVMQRHGYHLEHVIKPISSDGISQPDLIRIMYFDSQKEMSQMEKDPDNTEMMQLYESAVERSLWIMGKIPSRIGPVQELMGKG